jgi:glycosyltransferase involved in cell wall biosynthesis
VLALQYPYAAGAYEVNGVRVRSFNGRRRGRPYSWLLWWRVWLALTRINRQHQVIGLLSFWFGECAFIGHYFGRLFRIRHLAWLLGQDARAGNKILSFIRPRAASLIVLSDALATEVYRNYGLQPAHLIPFGVDPAVFPDLGGERNIDIMGAGSLIPLKRYHLFVDVVGQLVALFPRLRVVLCGQGPEQTALEARIEKAGLQDHITLLREVPHRQVLALMQQSRVFLHTSSYEGFAAVCAEALYAGAQVVSFCQPMRQPIRQWHIVHSEEEMVSRLEGLLGDPALAHERVLPFAMTKACAQIMALFGCQAQEQGA